MQIRYRFEHASRPALSFVVDVERAAPLTAGRGDWTRLDCCRCPNCPLDSRRHVYCPVAVDLEDVVGRFDPVMSFEDLTVVVEVPQRQVHKNCDAQSGLGALMGLIMASSACPIMGRLKPLARTHLPFQSVEESIQRFVGAYFLGQLLREQDGGEPDWSLRGLSALFDELTVVNRAFKGRIASAAEQDAAMNAVSALAIQLMDVQYSLADCAEGLSSYALRLDQDQ